MKRSLFFLLFLASTFFGTAFASTDNSSLLSLIHNLVSLNDWRSLPSYTEASLQIWDRPGTVWMPAAKVSAEDLRQTKLDPHLKELFDLTFQKVVDPIPQPRAFAEGPLVTLQNAKQHDYPGNDCERPTNWEGKWFVIPGDILYEECKQVAGDKKACEVGDMKATTTLVYHHKAQTVHPPKDKKIVDPFGNPMQRLIDTHSGENYYFGLKQQNGVWKIISFGTDSDCNV